MKLYLQDDESSDVQFVAVLLENTAVFENIIKTIGADDDCFNYRDVASVPHFNIYLINNCTIVENNLIDILTISGFNVITVTCEDDDCNNFGKRVAQEYS